MKMYAVAVHYNAPDKKKIVGFRILDLHSSDVKDYPYDAVKNVLLKKMAPIEGLTLDNKTREIKGSNGSLERYPALIGGNPINRSLVILNSIDDKGYQVSSFNGKTAFATRSEVVAFALKAGIANGKIVDKDGKKFVSAINGTYSNIPFNGSGLAKRKDIQMKKNDKELMKKQQDVINKKRHKVTYVTGPKVITEKQVDNSLMQMVDDITELTVEQKMTYVMMALKVIRPFCYSVYLCLNRVVTTDIETMGVTLRTLYFNPYFVLETSLPELIFITIHEVYHVSMKHKIRCQKRRHSIWNKACDYYINKQIAEEFGLDRPGDTKQATIGVKNTGYKISLPTHALFSSKVDTDTDTPEKLYEELLDIANKAEQQKNNNKQDNNGQNNSSQNSSGQSGDSSGQSGDSSEQDSSNENESGGSESSSKKGNSQGQGNKSSKHKQNSEQEDGEEQQSEKSRDSDESNGADTSDLDRLADGMDPSDEDGEQSDIMGDSSEDDSSNEGSDSSKGKSGNSCGDSDEQSEDGEEPQDELTGQSFRGDTIPDIESDIVNSPDEKAESSDRAEQIANSILKRAASVCRQQTGSFGGEAGSWIERYVEKALAPKVMWSSILRNKLTKASQKINTFAAPDKRFRSRGMVLPGPKRAESDSLENVKVCVDTSGSISPKDLGVALAQIEQLLKTFKAEAELMYWDTKIRVVYPFKDIKDIIDKKPQGGGGTDANCIFEYFENERDYKIGRKKKPSIIIIFTDGYIGSVNKKYSKYRDTIWVVQGNDSFEAPFGTKAPFKPE